MSFILAQVKVGSYLDDINLLQLLQSILSLEHELNIVDLELEVVLVLGVLLLVEHFGEVLGLSLNKLADQLSELHLIKFINTLDLLVEPVDPLLCFLL